MTTGWPKSVYSAAKTRAIDASIIAAGLSGLELMQRAAEALWLELLQQWPHANQLTVLCGKGNNGGDGYLVALLAAQAGLAGCAVRRSQYCSLAARYAAGRRSAGRDARNRAQGRGARAFSLRD